MEKSGPLQGTVRIQGSKNAVLPMMAASVLNKGVTVLEGCPDILDVRQMCLLLDSLGCQTSLDKGTLVIDAREIKETRAEKTASGQMRSSIILAGAMLGRCKEVTLAYPGGCSIGKRPIDMHLEAFRKLGVLVEEGEEEIYCTAKSLKGNSIFFRFPSVGATENAILAAVLAEGKTTIYHGAKEPEIEALCDMLNRMGAKITGAGADVIIIDGVDALHDVTVTVPSDRIVAGTYLLTVAGCGGEAELQTGCGKDLLSLYPVLEQLGCHIACTNSRIYIRKKDAGKSLIQVTTSTYPGFPTDLQSQLMAVLCKRNGYGIIVENIFENRYGQAEELSKLGADIHIIDHIAVVNGKECLKGAEVKARDLRGGAAMVMAGLMAEGETTIDNISYIQRGYQDICGDLSSLGARIHPLYRDRRE